MPPTAPGTNPQEHLGRQIIRLPGAFPGESDLGLEESDSYATNSCGLPDPSQLYSPTRLSRSSSLRAARLRTRSPRLSTTDRCAKRLSKQLSIARKDAERLRHENSHLGAALAEARREELRMLEEYRARMEVAERQNSIEIERRQVDTRVIQELREDRDHCIRDSAMLQEQSRLLMLQIDANAREYDRLQACRHEEKQALQNEVVILRCREEVLKSAFQNIQADLSAAHLTHLAAEDAVKAMSVRILAARREIHDLGDQMRETVSEFRDASGGQRPIEQESVRLPQRHRPW
ncbi:hypothetical protein V5O48_017661 [Marasmius crinis-equi]|uniref:Uncharacterized protein n=1 Tax=Marasmius crinis-equi TaxID=585013 RepID=A0ABR3ENI2_9AGAR